MNLSKPFNLLSIVFCTLVFSTVVLAQSDTDESGKQSKEENSAMPRVVIETSAGNIEIMLRPDVAPESVANFLSYAEDDFYQGTIFHRVIPGFMIQGGGFTETMERKSTGGPIKNEAKPTVKNLRGTIAMARTNAPDSATSQFFINLVDNAYLNAGPNGAGYTVFGRVTEGMGVVDAIAAKPTGRSQGMADVPKEPVIIRDIRRLEN